ncbi:MAG TPA: type VI secretion system contractile sheath large subunit, partial [Isosphaeraceae bacterium]|nr:type VI secretion system contractile sheath large subunit [Isosphaeraceae bacterium]
RLGQLARSVSARFVLEGSPRLAGCRDLASTPDPDDWSYDLPADVLEAWTDLRASEDADFLALALPAWVARWPYGPNRDPIETFGFEESPDPLSDTALLWANPIFAVARILGESLTSDHGTWPDLEDAILITHERDGETETRSPTRVPLGQRAFDRLLQSGLSPLVHETGTDRIRLPALVSLTEVRSPLFG